MSVCMACGKDGTVQDYFGNHWRKKDKDLFKRCRECVKAGKFSPEMSSPPPSPLESLQKRGVEIEDTAESAEIGERILSISDARDVLQQFAFVGHYGYGGIHEGLCCFPGCTASENLKFCANCHQARYCNAQHQRQHWKHHKPTCKQLQKMGNEPLECIRCQGKTEMRYGRFPLDMPSPVRGVACGGRLMCGKCASYYGIELENWIYPDA
mmetsp:Transcript_12734/g.16710  ORF Transcript_12734/g.16710 Transcript_12734/m.16710 type:complete len:210 (-) Transcript_12734:75-704(-)